MQSYHPITSRKRRSLRRSGGSAIAEFAPALIILAFLVFLPLLDLTIVPIRWMLAQQLVEQYARKLAFCETFSEAQKMVAREPSLNQRLQQLGGVAVDSLDLQLRATTSTESCIVNRPGALPAEWLPNGTKLPGSYTLEVCAHSRLSPAILVPLAGARIPGLSEPAFVNISASHVWENLGRDPVTKRFFLDE